MDVHGRDLRYFVAVAEELHFTRAAERLFISQPALSKQIRMLERQLGAPLFFRGRDGVQLTPVGQALLPYAREVLAAWDRGWAAAEQAKSRQAATLVAGMSTSPGRGGLMAAIRSRFTALQPGATVELRQASWGDPTAGLADGVVDVAFVWLPLPDPERYQWVVVAEEPRVVAMADGHPLAGRSTVEVGDLLDEPFLALPPARGRFGTTGWRPTSVAGGQRGSGLRSPAPRRPTRRWLTGGASACWRRATRDWSRWEASPPGPSTGCHSPGWPWPGAATTAPLVLDYARASREATSRSALPRRVPSEPTPAVAGGLLVQWRAGRAVGVAAASHARIWSWWADQAAHVAVAMSETRAGRSCSAASARLRTVNW